MTERSGVAVAATDLVDGGLALSVADRKDVSVGARGVRDAGGESVAVRVADADRDPVTLEVRVMVNVEFTLSVASTVLAVASALALATRGERVASRPDGEPNAVLETNTVAEPRAEGRVVAESDQLAETLTTDAELDSDALAVAREVVLRAEVAEPVTRRLRVAGELAVRRPLDDRVCGAEREGRTVIVCTPLLLDVGVARGVRVGSNSDADDLALVDCEPEAETLPLEDDVTDDDADTRGVREIAADAEALAVAEGLPVVLLQLEALRVALDVAEPDGLLRELPLPGSLRVIDGLPEPLPLADGEREMRAVDVLLLRAERVTRAGVAVAQRDAAALRLAPWREGLPL